MHVEIVKMTCACIAGGSKKDSNIQYVRPVPKFLQGHMHLLGRKLPEDEVEAQLASVDEDNNGAGSEDDEKVTVLDNLSMPFQNNTWILMTAEMAVSTRLKHL